MKEQGRGVREPRLPVCDTFRSLLSANCVLKCFYYLEIWRTQHSGKLHQKTVDIFYSPSYFSGMCASEFYLSEKIQKQLDVLV